MIAVLIIVITILLIKWVVYLVNVRKYNKISFKKSIYNINLPIITFYNNKRKLNFILDTGANQSVINERELNSCSYKKILDTQKTMNISGDTHIVEYMIYMNLQDKANMYDEKFQVSNLSKAFDILGKVYKMPIHGILGNTFFIKNKAILNFDSMEVYI